MFEDAILVKRLSWSTEVISWNKYLHNDDYLGTDASAPWPNAAKLKEWKKGEDGMKADDSYKKGEVANKTTGRTRRSDDTSLAVRETETEYDYGLAIYCVNCGTRGSFSVGGAIDFSFLKVKITECSAGLTGNMQFEMNLGINAFVTYKKDYKSAEKRINIYTVGIAGIAQLSPYIQIQLTAGFGIEASGELLLGGGLYWDNIEFKLDLASKDNTYARGLVPRFEKRAEAKGQVEIGAYVGLPIELGLAFTISDPILDTTLWEAKVGATFFLHIMTHK